MLSTEGYPSLTHSLGVNPKGKNTKFGLKKLETSLCRTVLKYRQTIISFCHNTCVWQTDGRTDRQTDRQTDVDSKTVRVHSQSHGKSEDSRLVVQQTMWLLQSHWSNGRVDIQETNSSASVTIVPTVPISCPPCSMTLRIVNPVGLTVSTCSVTFSHSDPPMTAQTINIRAVPTTGSNSRVTQLEFRRVDTHVSGSGWDRYILEPITVSTIAFLWLLFDIAKFHISWRIMRFSNEGEKGLMCVL